MRRQTTFWDLFRAGKLMEASDTAAKHVAESIAAVAQDQSQR
jgi:hypothetical protein